MGGSKKPDYNVPPWQEDLINKAQGGYGQQQEDIENLKKYLGPIAQGQNLYGGEGFNQALEAAKNKIIPSVESKFEQGGRFGSGLARQAESGAIGDAFAGLYGQERQLQQQAIDQMANLSGLPQKNLASILGSIPTPQGQYPGNKLAGAAGGALSGGLAGSYFGPPGAVIGALGGGISGGLS